MFINYNLQIPPIFFERDVKIQIQFQKINVKSIYFLTFLILHTISENFLYFCELENLKVVWQAMIYAVIACNEYA